MTACEESMPTIVIAWSGLPPYAIYCIRDLIEKSPFPIHVLGTRADVPHERLEYILGRKITWLVRNERYSWSDIDIPCPDVFIHTGWAYPEFNRLGNMVKKSGGLRISMIDTNWKGTLRQYIGLLVFRLRYRIWFDAIIVPGIAGRQFCRFLGMPNNRVHEGLYCSPPSIFNRGPTLKSRPKCIIFVGRFIERKGFRILIDAVDMANSSCSDWEFVFIGSGPLGKLAEGRSNVKLLPFSNAETIAIWMKQSRFLVLPSFDENWGVVVHEAASCGCGLLLSETVGSAVDLCTAINGRVFKPGRSEAILDAIVQVSAWDDETLTECEAQSRRLAANFAPSVFSSSILELIKPKLNLP